MDSWLVSEGSSMGWDKSISQKTNGILAVCVDYKHGLRCYLLNLDSQPAGVESSSPFPHPVISPSLCPTSIRPHMSGKGWVDLPAKAGALEWMKEPALKQGMGAVLNHLFSSKHLHSIAAAPNTCTGALLLLTKWRRLFSGSWAQSCFFSSLFDGALCSEAAFTNALYFIFYHFDLFL